MRALLALLVLAAIGAVFVVWTGAARAPTSAPPAEARADVRQATAASLANAADAVPAATSTPDAQRQAVESTESEIANVRVVLASTGEPVAGAIVRYHRPSIDLSVSDTAKLLLEEYASGEAADREALLQRVGAEVVSDAEGRCRLHIGESETVVVARFGELFAQDWVYPDSDHEIVLRLRPDHALRVLVLDADGRPAPDIPVQMWCPDAPSMPHDVGPTDAAGRCVFHHVQRLLDAGAANTQQIAAMPPGGQTSEVTFDVATPPPEIVLQLPSTGSVTVRLRDAAGDPLDTTLLAYPDARLQAFDSELASREGRRTGYMWDARIGANAEAVFGHVALDCYLVVSQGLVLERGCPGPTAAKAHVDVTLQESQQDVILFATLRLPDARPVARGLLVTCRSRGDTASCEVGTDAAGRMRCNLGAFGTSDDCVINIASYDRQEDNDISVELAPRKVDAGVNDLGELRLAAQGLLVAGRLVRDPGVRAEHVQIDFERRYGDQWQRQRANLYPDWQPDDSFSLCSEIPAGTAIRLVVQPGAYLPVDPIECKAGDRDVEIRLRAAGELTATFLVDDSTPVDRLVFRLRQRPPHPIDERVLDYMSRFGESPKDGRMPRWWRGLTPGTYDLTVACAGVAEPIASVAGMTVGTGPCTDPRLDAIDLRGRLRTFEVRATDAGGQPIADENAFVIVCSSREWSCYGLGNGRASIYATTSLDVVVTAPGCRATRVHGVAGSRTIALERDQPTAFRVAWPLPLPDGVTATLRLVPKVDLPHDERVVLDNDWGMPIWKLLEQFERRALVGRDGACSVPVVWPGEYTVEVSLATGERLVQLRDVAPTTVVLPAPGEIVLTIDRASCDAALQRVRK